MSHGDPEQINRASAEQARAARRFAEPDGWEADARAERKGKAVTGTVRDKALDAVIDERDRQDAKWGEQNHDPFAYLAILSEEVGELSQAALHLRFPTPLKDGPHLRHLRDEAVQVAAVALAIVECIDRAKWKWPL